MLLIFAVVAVLSGLGAVVVAKVAHFTMNQLGLEFWSVMFWFGLADAPVSELVVRRRAERRVIASASP